MLASARAVALSLVLAGLGGCASAPPPPPVERAPERPPVRLILRSVEVQASERAALTASLARLDRAICQALFGRRGWDALCPADAEALLELVRTRAMLGGCEDDDCAQSVEALTEGEQELRAGLARHAEAGRFVLSLERRRADGGRLKTGQRVGTIEELEEGMAALVEEALAGP